MKKSNGLLILAATISLSACSWELPTCNDELNECGRDSAYTEERTVKANRNRVPPPMPEPVVMPEPEPEPVAVIEPEPEPVIVDTQIMTTAEPEFTQISK